MGHARRHPTLTTTLLFSILSILPLRCDAGPLYPRANPILQVFPIATSQYDVATGAISFGTARGLVSRSPTNHGADTTTLVTFALDAAYSANLCQVVFGLNDPSSSAAGTMQAQLFTSLAPATASTTTWPPGNQRNNDLGSIQAVKGGYATWLPGTGPLAPANGFFKCSDIAGQLYGYEVVPQGDQVAISWPAGTDGVSILVYQMAGGSAPSAPSAPSGCAAVA